MKIDYGIFSNGVTIAYETYAYRFYSDYHVKNSDYNGCAFNYSNFDKCKFFNCTFTRCDFTCSHLYDCTFEGCLFTDCHFNRADLSRTYMKFCDFQGSNKMDNAILTECILPDKESIRKGIILSNDMVGYKACYYPDLYKKLIVELLIPKGNIVFSINNDKCRTQSARVTNITDPNDKRRRPKIAESTMDNHFMYEIDEWVYPNGFDLMYNRECAKGIHFFRTYDEAVGYLR